MTTQTRPVLDRDGEVPVAEVAVEVAGEITVEHEVGAGRVARKRDCGAGPSGLGRIRGPGTRARTSRVLPAAAFGAPDHRTMVPPTYG
jgi:hypothetical protein